MKWEKLLEALDELETTVEYDGYFCSIQDAVAIVVLGSLCELKSVMKIHAWANSDSVKVFLKTHFGIEHIPCYGWLLELLALITPESLNKCMMHFVYSLLPDIGAQIEQEKQEKAAQKKPAMTIAVDGKTVRSTVKMERYESPLHIISAQVCEIGVTLAQKTVDGKSNEIPAVQELLPLLKIKGCMVTADAMNCQIDTAQAIIDAKADYLLNAKNNQPTLKTDIEQYVQDETLRRGMESFSKEEKGHGRKEVRTAYVSYDVGWEPGGRHWPNLACIGAIQTCFKTKGQVTEQWHYYISSKELTAQELLHHARMEWQVETMHWLLDVHFKEDKCRVLDKNVQQNLNMARKLTLNIVKIYKRDNALKKALSGIMFDCLMEPLHILTVLGKN